MSTDDDRKAALAEVAALRAVLHAQGLGTVVDGTDPADRRGAAADDAAIARILAADAGAGDPDGRAPAPRPVRTDAEAAPAPVVPLRARRVRPWWLAATGAAAAVAVAAGFGLSELRTPAPAVATGSPPMLAYPLDPDDLAQGAGEPARETLLELAAVADAQVDPEPRGQVQHTLSQSWLLSTNAQWDGTADSTVDPTVVESWLGPDGSLVSVEWRGTHLDAAGRLGAVDTSPAEAAVDRLRAGSVDPDLVTGLSLDPDTLRAQLRAPLAATGCGPDAPADAGAWCLYRAVTDLSARYVLPSDVEAAVWEALADEPGVTLAGEVVDRTGRRAVAVSVPGAPTDLDPTVRVLLVDRGTGRLSGLEEVVLSSQVLGFAEPTVTQFRYVVTSDMVGEVGGPAARR
ncbi:CU044_5270 family protein [Cellulomonas sp. C5510]|uniref:CU044_5270 family protein n=1 Tax=Cellulomonas sp. C5510 TaxID=2871170 RepID=UPI001C96DC6D|nr:CU044_5270 family protein [Cellulomonas sp. C5510]QZN84844.1 CU044_5270 family protein [Cellulomonas sp. C5510]